MAQVSARDPWLREHPVQVEWWGGQFASGSTRADSPVAAAVAAAHRRVRGSEVATWAAPFGSDLRLMTGIGRVPTVHYGPGEASLAHGPDERVPIVEVVDTARVLAIAALELCGVSG